MGENNYNRGNSFNPNFISFSVTNRIANNNNNFNAIELMLFVLKSYRKSKISVFLIPLFKEIQLTMTMLCKNLRKNVFISNMENMIIIKQMY